jgi:mono/diheme cytochrome c family protein
MNNARYRIPSPGVALGALSAVLTLALALQGCADNTGPNPGAIFDGQEVFRHATFGNERFWTDTLGLHEVIASAVDPQTALAVGLKVDAEALPAGLLEGADLSDPATTVELIRHDAVVGVRGRVTEEGQLERVGITCALCHSTVDDAVAPGIGSRRDGWPNLDLDVGAIVALSPALPEGDREVFRSWGPGRYDAYFNVDGINDPTVIPPAYGLQDVPLETFTGEGPISYWNAYVAVTQMHGLGSFAEPELGIDVEASPDSVNPKLPALLEYQLTLQTPEPPVGTVDRQAADRGRAVFSGKAGCADCHVPPTYTDAPRLHDPSETGTDPTLAERSVTGQYRTTPLRGLVHHPPYFHDGSAETLSAVVEHYDQFLGLGLTEAEKSDLVAFLETL